MDKKNIIPIVFFSEEETTITLLSIAMISLLENAEDDTIYKIKIIHKKKYSNETIDTISNLQKKYINCEISFIYTNSYLEDNCLLISNVLIDVDKCIYLHHDVIVQKDLTELYNLDLCNMYLGGVKEIDQDIINQSVLVLNCNKIREDALDNISFNNIKQIQLKYNLRADYLMNEKSFNFSRNIQIKNEIIKLFNKKELQAALKENVIFSYQNGMNPLNEVSSSFVYVWYKYFIISPYYEDNINIIPKISVIVPVFNVDKYLEKCVLSIVNQDYPNLQIILIDDGSTDTSGSLCYDLSKKDNRITVIYKKNSGLSSARNCGMDIADGEYISFIDSDDYIHPQTYSIAIKTFDLNTGLDLVEWGMTPVKDVCVERNHYTDSDFNLINNTEIILQDQVEFIQGTILRSPNSPNVCTKMFKLDFLYNKRFEVGKINEDVFFTNNYMLDINKTAFIMLPLYYVLIRSGSITRQNITYKNLDEFRGFALRYKIIKSNYPELLEVTCEKDLAFFYTRIKEIALQGQDENSFIRKELINIILYCYDDIMKFDKIEQYIKDDFILIKNDITSFIDKYDEKLSYKISLTDNEIKDENLNQNKISVIIPVYNVEKYLNLCIDSILNQTHKNLEIILVDDGSTDNSGFICDEYLNKDDRIIVIHKENGGLSSARNYAMDVMTGDYVSFIDSDDYIHPQTYSIALGIFNKKEEIDLVEWEFLQFYNIITKYENVEFSKLNNVNIEINNRYNFIFELIHYRKHKQIVCNKLFKKDLIYNIRFLYGKFAEDIFFTNDYLEYVKKVAYIPLNLYYYYQRVGSSMNSDITMNFIDDIDAFYQRHLIIKRKSQELIVLSLERVLLLFYNRMKNIVKQNNDHNMSMRIETVTRMIEYYFDDVIESKEVNINIKNDFILAKNNTVDFIIIHEKRFELQYILPASKYINSNLNVGKISVIIPVYNVEEYLERCVLSIVHQEYMNLEIILVDDGSTDNSGKMCDEFAIKYKRIVVIHKENGGLSSARNAGMDIATGNYISFIDSDDFIHQQTYSIALSLFNNTDFDYVQWKFLKTDDNKYDNYQQTQFDLFSKIEYEVVDDINIFLDGHLSKISKFNNIVWDKLFKFEFIKDFRFDDGAINEDIFFYNKIIPQIKKFAFINEKLHYYYQRKDSIMNSIIQKKNIDLNKAYFEKHLMIKKYFPKYTLLSLIKGIDLFYIIMNRIFVQNIDEDMAIRKLLVEVALQYYDDLIECDSQSELIISNQVSKFDKKDFILAKEDIITFIEKYVENEQPKSLYIVNSVYQLFNTINYKLNLDINDKKSDLILSDHTPMLKNFYETLVKTELFDTIYLVESLKIINIPIKQKENQNILLNSKNILDKISNIEINQYNELFCSNFDLFTKIIYNSKPTMSVNIIEDGISTYSIDWKPVHEQLKNIPKYFDIFNAIRNCYVYEPNLMLYNTEYTIKSLPKIDKSYKELVNIINNIFKANLPINLPKFIFLEQFFENANLNDLPLLETLSSIVGKDNFYIKNHPRSPKNRAKILDLSKQIEYNCPFEVLLLNINLEDHVFFTINSTSLTSINLVFGSNAKIVYLDKLFKMTDRVNVQATAFLDNYISKNEFKNIMRPKNYEEFENIIFREIINSKIDDKE